MGKWQWPSLRFPKLHFRVCDQVLFAALLFEAVLNFIPASVLAQEGSGKSPPANTSFDGTYVIHLSESARVRSSARPEPGYFDTLAIELFVKAGIKVEIMPQMPWKRQLELAERETGHVIYPTTRIDYREDLFQWVGPVSRTFWNLYGFTDSGWADMDFKTLLRDARIGVLLGSARESYLRERGAKQLIMVPREELLLPMMMAGRVDLIAIGGNILRHYVDEAREEDPGIPDISGAAPYRICYLYIAISGAVPEGDVKKLQAQLDTFKRDGFFVENRGTHGLSTNLDSSFLKAMLNLDNNGISCVDVDRVGP
ncbi:ABC transporter substrate-binding protein [Thalassospira sp. HJ]|uniref:substrate-binding periplasmic protein n=1 Tax=Thalassospira sp. HJ TaxID=1616823 RepID=UPI0005CED8E6|nr:transporter substrate-binding domain-containing protein [Thalassospira sp. HJ]KJE34212.1 ABC transporter substrate-binding protein [Thalassospira sp. HJ]